jgi:hypothetical protein
MGDALPFRETSTVPNCALLLTSCPATRDCNTSADDITPQRQPAASNFPGRQSDILAMLSAETEGREARFLPMRYARKKFLRVLECFRKCAGQ